ncbi:MAG: hypothetical protein HY909_12780 [Deltaproteobacteria bacterium]|nr:hypothetical protein [Deltaproteobacteria bacterium]
MKHFSLWCGLLLLAGSLGAQPRPVPGTPAGPPPTLSRAAVVDPGPGTWAPVCIAQRGCVPHPPLPRCPSAVTADLVPLRGAGEGARVMTRGRLRAVAGCTELACPPGRCCNGCHGGIQLEAEGRTITLGAPGDPAFACAGDDSGLCCGSPVPAGEVGVRGTWRRARTRGASPYLEGVTLCQP